MRLRPGFLAVLLPCLALALLPAGASAQDNAGSCAEVGSQGTKHDYRCRMGPVTVGPFQVLTKEMVFDVPKPDVDGFVTSMNVDVVDASGKRVPIRRLMLHHIVLLNFGKALGDKRDPTCGAGFESWDTMELLPNAAERFFAAGEERAETQLPEGYGYPISKQDTWLMVYMFMNHRSVTDTAYVEYNVTVDTRADLTPVDPYWLDVGQCGTDPVYDVAGRRAQGLGRQAQVDLDRCPRAAASSPAAATCTAADRRSGCAGRHARTARSTPRARSGAPRTIPSTTSDRSCTNPVRST